MRTPICDQLGIEFPIFAFSHCRDVVATVTNAGAYGVLGALGWRVVRVASIDWLRDPDAVLARIERELEAAAPNAS